MNRRLLFLSVLYETQLIRPSDSGQCWFASAIFQTSLARHQQYRRHHWCLDISDSSGIASDSNDTASERQIHRWCISANSKLNSKKIWGKGTEGRVAREFWHLVFFTNQLQMDPRFSLICKERSVAASAVSRGHCWCSISGVSGTADAVSAVTQALLMLCQRCLRLH